jgi:hypothetical protein
LQLESRSPSPLVNDNRLFEGRTVITGLSILYPREDVVERSGYYRNYGYMPGIIVSLPVDGQKNASFMTRQAEVRGRVIKGIGLPFI